MFAVLYILRKSCCTHADGVHIAREHETASMAGLTAAALLLLPGEWGNAVLIIAASFRQRRRNRLALLSHLRAPAVNAQLQS